MGYESCIEFDIRFKSKEKALEYFEKEKKEPHQLMYCPLYFNIKSKEENITGKSLDIELEETCGKFSYDSELWAYYVKDYIHGVIEFYGEVPSDIWKLEFKNDKIYYYEAYIEFREVDVDLL